MFQNKRTASLSIKRIVLISCTLLIALWLATMVNTWVNVQKMVSNHQREDSLQDTTLTILMILKSVDETLLTSGTIPSLNNIGKNSKELDSLLINLKKNNLNNDLILTFLEKIVKEKLILDKKLSILAEWPEEISNLDSKVMIIAGSISAISESMLTSIIKIKEEVNNRVLLARSNIQYAIILTVIITTLVSLLIFIFLYKGISRPFNDLLHTTETLELEKAVAEKANQAKSEFLSRMSHELRTPLNTILGFGQVLELDTNKLDESQKKNVRYILDAGHHLLNLINEVLDLAKIESGKMEVSMEEIPVSDVLQQCLALISGQAEARQLELIDHVSSKNHIAQADNTRLKQVLLNLLSNAVKYGSDHNRIILNSHIIDNQRLRISVTDTGKGLTETEITKLFTPFERLNTVNNVDGTGIGLVISKQLMELMDGDIGVDSTPDKGSTFTIELPTVR